MVSGDSEGLIKIWNHKKDLIREIKFTEPVTAVCFLNEQADILVGHYGKLSRVNAKDYIPAEKEGEQTFKEYCSQAVDIPDKYF